MLTTCFFALLALMQAVTPQPTSSTQVPEVVEAAAPGYPRLPSGGRESGEVQVEVVIGPSGDVVSAKALSGPERLRGAAEGAARKWRFKARRNRTERSVITFGFNLRPGLGETPAVVAVFRASDRIDVFAEERKVVTISDPPFEDVDKVRKKQKKQK